MTDQPAASVDLLELAREADLEAEQLTAKSERAAAAAEATRARVNPLPDVLQPEFVDKLNRSMAEPLRRMRRIAKIHE